MVEQSQLEEQIETIEEQLQKSAKMADMEAKFIENANKQYEKNLLAFQKYLPDVYERFVNFRPKEEFKLFLNENGTPNIIDYRTKCPIYSEHPLKQVEEQVNNSIETPVLSKLDYSYLSRLDNEFDFIHVDLLKNAGSVYSKAQKELVINNHISGKIPSVVIFGVGLGYHLEQLLEQVPSEYINLFEPEEDYFYASLFTFDWYAYLERIDETGGSFYLSVGISEEEVYNELYRRTQEHGPFIISNSFFYQHYPSQPINNLIAKLRDNFHEFFMGWGFIDDAFMSLAHSCENVKKGLPFYDAHSSANNRYKDYPVLIVANGPSLDQDIEKIKEIRDHVLIVACNSASTALIKNGITPDFHAALERSRETYDFIEHFVPEEYRKQMSLLTLNVMHQDVTDLFPWTGLALKGREAGTSLHQVAEIFARKPPSENIAYCNPLVGNMAFSFVISMGFKNIYLLGVDNGYVDPAHHHSKSSMYYNKQGETVYKPLQIGSNLVVPGNFGGEVIADHFLYSGKLQMERMLATEKADKVSCFNCSDGAKIEGTIPLRSENIILEPSNIDRQTVADYIRQDLFVALDSDFNLEDYLDFEGFEKLCDTMLDILAEPVSSREEAFEQIMRQIRVLVSLKKTQFSHHYMVLEGEALYLNSIIINMLFNYGDSDSILPYYQELKEVWCAFLRKATQLYKDNWNKSSDHVFAF